MIRELLRDALAAGLVELAGWLGQGSRAEPRYLPSVRGRVFARDALRHCRYLGPAPVALTAYQEQILKQRMATEEIDPGALDHCLDGLDVPSAVGRGLAPAIRSGGAILLHGAGGEPVGGIAAQISRLFAGAIHVPHAVEIEGQIMRVFDPDVHECTGEPPPGFDHRWTRVRRPDVRIGGDLTLDMLAPRLSAETKYHEAPMHLKALGGVFTMADFGAQAVAPHALMSRWAKPMESRIDVLKLKNGRRSFTVPFEELLIFSTTRPPEELIPPAILARIPHRIALDG